MHRSRSTNNLSRFSAWLSIALLALAALSACSRGASQPGPLNSRDFEFASSGRTLSGVLDQPATGETRAVAVFVHGTGMTDVRGDKPYLRLRQTFAGLGIASLIWDKPGLGRSEGRFDDNQPLETSAREVLDAVQALRARNIPGAGRIVIWSISRGTWVAPIAMSQDPTIKWWISVGGMPAADNKHYLMESNLPLEGRSIEQTNLLMEEWRRGRRIFFGGGGYDAYLAATENLRQDPAVFYFAGDLTGTRETYAAEQNAYLQARDFIEIDEATTSVISVPRFDEMLKRLNVDVLALFGERDTNVDWRRARALYEATLGGNPRTSLRIRTFPGCNHVINASATGWVREVQAASPEGGNECGGYYETQVDWLRQHVVEQAP